MPLNSDMDYARYPPPLPLSPHYIFCLLNISRMMIECLSIGQKPHVQTLSSYGVNHLSGDTHDMAGCAENTGRALMMNGLVVAGRALMHCRCFIYAGFIAHIMPQVIYELERGRIGLSIYFAELLRYQRSFLERGVISALDGFY